MVDFLIVAALGVLTGIGEIVSRYRDEPGQTMVTLPSLLYLGLNAAIAASALLLVRGYGWSFGAGGDAARLTQILIAGLGAMGLLRSSLFIVRIGNEDVGLGPSTIVRVILDAVDRAVDRNRGAARNTRVRQLMADISFERAYEVLPAYCLALVQNLPAADQTALGTDVDRIRGSQMSPRSKSLLLGLALLNKFGERLVTDAVNSLRNEISTTDHGLV